MHYRKSISLLSAILAALLILLVSTSYAQKKEDEAFYTRSSLSMDTIFYLESITGPLSPCEFAVPVPAGFVTDIAIDRTYDRVVYCADDFSTIAQLGFFYASDVSDALCPGMGATPDVRTIFDTDTLTLQCTNLAVDGARDVVYFINQVVDSNTIQQIGFKEGAIPADATTFFDGSSSSEFSSIIDFAVDQRSPQRLYVLTDDSIVTSNNRIYYYTGTGNVDDFEVLTGIPNTVTEIRFDPVNDRLYALDTSGQSVSVYDAGLDGSLSMSPQTIGYMWSMPFPPSIQSIDLIFNEDGSGVENAILGNSSSGLSDDVILRDDASFGNKNDGNKPLPLFTGNEIVTRVAGRSQCSAFQFDTDGDTIADCLDECPNDDTNMCQYLLYARTTGDMIGESEFIRHELDPAIVQGGMAFPDISIGGFYQEVIDQFVYDQTNRVIYYTSTPVLGQDNSLYKIDLQTNEKIAIATFSDPMSSVLGIEHMSLDTDTGLLYVVIEDELSDLCDVKAIDTASITNDLEDEMQNPRLFQRVCNGTNSFFGDLVVDQRFNSKDDSSYDKRLYYSYKEASTVGIYEVDLSGDVSDTSTHLEITQGQFNSGSNSIGALAIDFNNDQLYYHTILGMDGSIHFNQLPAMFVDEQNNEPQTNAPQVFVDIGEVSNDEDVRLFYHPTIFSMGRLYISDPFFPSMSDDDAFKYKNIGSTGCAMDCLEDEEVVDMQDITQVEDFSMYVACQLPDPCQEGSCASPNLDTNNDGFPDCSTFEDNCPNNDGKLDPGVCGCGRPDDSLGCVPADVGGCGDGERDFPGACGCTGRPNDTVSDSDRDGVPDCVDVCPEVPNPTDSEGNVTNIFPICGCGVEEDLSDPDNDGVPSCNEDCTDSFPNVCGCGITDCSGINGERLTPTTRITGAPGINNNKRGGRKRKRRFRLNLKKFSGAVLNTSSELNGFKTSERNRKLKVRYRVTIQKLVGNKLRTVKRILSNKAVTRLLRLNNGKYTVRYKAIVKRKKKTVSQTNFSPSRSFNIPFS